MLRHSIVRTGKEVTVAGTFELLTDDAKVLPCVAVDDVLGLVEVSVLVHHRKVDVVGDQFFSSKI
jgi:hypothetical protein